MYTLLSKCMINAFMLLRITLCWWKTFLTILHGKSGAVQVTGQVVTIMQYKEHYKEYHGDDDPGPGRTRIVKAISFHE